MVFDFELKKLRFAIVWLNSFVRSQVIGKLDGVHRVLFVSSFICIKTCTCRWALVIINI